MAVLFSYSLLPTPYSLLPTPYSLLPTPDSLLPRCAFRRRIKFATGRTAPDSLLPSNLITQPHVTVE
ncbi:MULTISPECIES: hypothetical protein [Moorena]|uniref:hypothetical protein n=1 Tax=Moorena TaxID=1155738 RepID=UPI0002FBD625|nr:MULTISPECIES: hypothetical protein [Moorena]NEQ15030.1 hypothetical protein [Moorena sp. SIO3E2]NEP32337.1 hypothetical protein [Moorena sp. SIO3B2]NEP67452.1 hypothetical protein [Moorena sp. SIO3A5]NEQ06437.1 hypothetical protein [Moorena sp. SIO4E2]NER89007.1 hypothetical protein [Moorena sp. SIO3A2]